MANELVKAIAAVQKIAGKGFKLPFPGQGDLDKANEAWDKATAAFAKARTELLSLLSQLENSAGAIETAFKQVDAFVDQQSFGLTDKKQIKVCQGLMTKAIAADQKDFQKNIHDIDELRKHITHIGNYKPSKRG